MSGSLGMTIRNLGLSFFLFVCLPRVHISVGIEVRSGALFGRWNPKRRIQWPRFWCFITRRMVTSRQWRTLWPKVAKASRFKVDQAAPVAAVAELANYDAIVVGTGTRFGRVSSQMASFLDQAGGLWASGALNGKVGAAFTSSATQHGGQETTLFSIITNLLHFGMVVVGMDYGFAPQMTLDEISGGAPYGATTIAGTDGSRQPSEGELQGARYQGRRVAEVAARLHA
jgi:NAD(P)H dehydrogenase (quinone)